MSRIFKNFSISFFIFFISEIGFAGGDDISVLQEELDMILTVEYNPCFDQLEGDISDDSNITSVIQLSGIGSFSQGDEIMSSSNVKAIVESYDSITNQITYYQTAKTGFKSFSIGDKLVGKGLDVLTIEEFVLDFVVPCSDLVVSIEEDPEQMIFIFADSEAASQAKLAAQELMAEIETEMARKAALEAFQQKLEAEKAAAAAATAAYRDALLEAELDAFEAQLEAELAAAAEQLAIEKELAAFEAALEAEARQAALEAFQQKLEAEKAAAARSTAIYQARLQQEQMIKDRQAQLALERELAAFEAELEAELAAAAEQLAIEKELAAFEARLEAELAAQEMMAEIEAEMARQAALEAFQEKLEAERAAAAAATAAYRDALLEAELDAFEAKLEAELAAQEMMAEIKAEMARQAALEAFLQKLEDEKAAAASSTAAYQAKVAYEKRVTKIMDDLLEELDEFNLSGEYKSTISDELIKEATAKLEEETFVGAISGEIVTEAIHDFCKVNLGLSESNIELFKKALEGGYLGNVGPQVDYGTEFTANRWQKYIDCVGSKR